MRASYGELKIVDILTNAGLDFKEEYTFKDLTGNKGWALRFDFAVFDDDGDLDFLLEYQGEQHYHAKSKFGGAAGLAKQQAYDKMKRDYCKQHGITLVCIPYWDYQILDYDYIMKAAYGW